MHVVLVEVLGPDGKARDHYSQKLVARDGRASGRFTTALNDPAGRWTIRATDYISRVKGAAALQLRP